MVTVLVREHVRLAEVASAGPEPGSQLVEEAEVEVYAAVGRTVERPDLGRRRAAAGGDRPGEERRGRERVGGTAARELVVPVVLDRVDVEHEAAVGVLLDVGAGLAFLLEAVEASGLGLDLVAVSMSWPGWPPVHSASSSKGDGPDAASRGHGSAAPQPTTVRDLRRVQACPAVELHASVLLVVAPDPDGPRPVDPPRRMPT